jgi:streptogramin lyase
MACCVAAVACLAVAPGIALAGGSLSGEGSGPSSLGGSLVVAGSPTEGEQVLAGERARLANPEAVAAREVSRTKFEHLSAGQAAKVAGEAFPGVIDRPAGGTPQLPAGQKITGYLTDNAASVDVGGDRHALIESIEPIAVQSSPGHRTPIDLGLREDGSSFAPTTAAVGVSIPKRLSDGVSLPGVGVSLTPVDGSGAALGGAEGTVDGASVLYANTQTDTDSLVKPTTDGFEADTLLRSVDSPDQLFFKVGLPAGARLVRARGGSGAVQVVKAGATIATVLSPGAQDAAGTAVPVSMSVSGDTLVLSVADHMGEYQYPIEVDPEVSGKDVQLVKEGTKRSNWEFYELNGKKGASTNFASSEASGILTTSGVHEYKESEVAFWVYQTRGVSKIYEFEGETEASNKEDHIESIIELQYGEVETEHGTTEAKEVLSAEAEGTSEYKKKPLPKVLCPSGTASCPESAGHEGNAVHFQQSVVNKPTSKDSFSDELDKGTVYISEPSGTHSTASENTTTPEFEVEVENSKKEKEKQKRANALYGSSNWLSEYKGAIQFIAKDTGIGVSRSILEYENAGKWEAVSGSEHNYLIEDLCKGVQCAAEQKEYWTLNPHLPNGEDKIRYRSEEAFGQETHQTESLETEAVGTVKVDTSKPHGIFISGLPWGNELSEKPYEFTAYATDGEGSTVASSGIASIEVYVDGKSIKAIKEGEGKCSEAKGECTASAKYKIEGSELGAGHHAIVIKAKDNAGNEGREEESISIRHSTPVPMGPGNVDLESGDFTLGPTDVSLGSGLSVSRVYSSRDLTAGVEGGSLLGPQWSLSLGSEESLDEMPDHSVLVTSGSGGQTIFAAILNEKNEPTGKFESPPGDSNLTMTLEENGTKEKLAYYLKDPAAGTSTKFTFNSTTKVWLPEVQEGSVPTDTVSYLYETVEVGGKKVTRPSEERGATPAKVSCSPKMEPGCRALRFTYATNTSAGEKESQWGEYEGRLSKVSYEGYNPATKKMIEKPIPVAEYAYDSKGRLRAEWDPRISPALKTMYGYDTEGHVTALDPPGQEPWTFTYGTVAGDAGTGRLLKVAQAPTSAGLWNGEQLEYPGEKSMAKVTGTPMVGMRLGVTKTTFSSTPLSYVYQWYECKPTLKECTPILGATNENYVPTASNIGRELVVSESATNGGGTYTPLDADWSSASGVVKTASEYAVSKEGEPKGPVLGPDGNMWFANHTPTKSTIDKITNSGTITEYTLPGEDVVSDIYAGPGGDLWFIDTGSTSGEGHIGKITTSGTITQYTPPKESRPAELVTGPDGNLWFVESGAVGGGTPKPQIGKITTAGKITEYALPEKSAPAHLIVGPDSNLWFAETGLGKIAKITTSGTISPYSLSTGYEADGLTSGSDGNLWFTELNSSTHVGKIGKITTGGEIAAEYPLPVKSERESHPGTIITGPDKNLWFTLYETEKGGYITYSAIGKITTAGTIIEYPQSVEASPNDLVVGPDENLWFRFTSSSGKEIGKITTSGKVTEYSLPEGSTPNGITGGSNGNLWFYNKRQFRNKEDSLEETGAIEKINLTPEGEEPNTPEPGATIDYNVPVSGSGAPHNMSASEVAKWGQKAEEAPEEATAIFPPDSPQGWPASSYTRANIYYLDGEGRVVNTVTPSAGKYGAISTTEYNDYNNVVRTLSPDNRAAALETGEKSAEVANLLSTVSVYNEQGQCRKETDEPEKEVAEPGTRLCETWGPEHRIRDVETKPSEVLARNHTKYYYEDIKNGAPEEIEGKKQAYDLVTETQDLAQWFSSEGKSEGEVESRRSTTSYEGQGGQEKNLGWKLREPTLVTDATESGGAKVAHTTLYNENGQVIETRGPEGSAGKSAHDSQIIYYGKEVNKEYKECGEHPEWAGLVCRSLPAKQPETTGVPNLPETTTTYNIWNEPETTVETFPKSGSFAEHTRTTKNEYDADGRMVSSEETSTATTGTTDKALPKVTEEYNLTTGVLEKQSATVKEASGKEKTKAITSKYNTLGQLESYTDADGNVAKFKYAGPEGDGLLEEMSDGSDEGNSSQKYTYSTTTKQLEKLVDFPAGTFTASYDTEGKLASEVYPNGMCANYTDNSIGEATGIEYVKSATCSEKSAGVWFSETKIPSIRGEVMSRTSTLAGEEYTYDTLGRLKEVQETPAGGECSVRLYEYENESNRTKLTSRKPGSKGECATTGGTEEKHTYDEANRLTDSGIEYDSLGNVTKLPSGDAEGHALESTFYVDNAVATQTQNGVTNDYYMDPVGRVRETISGAQKTITHYDGSGEAVAWTCEGAEKSETCESGGKWTRNIPGIDGTLTAVENGKGATYETPILQLHDLEGDVAATIKDKTGETKLESTYNSTEFGAPNGGKEPPKFAWLGAGGVEKSLASGVITEGATSYVPQTGMALQSEEVAPPGLPDGSGGQAADFTASPWNLQGAERVGAEAPGKEAQREQEAYEAALNAAGTEDPTTWFYVEGAEKAASGLEKLSSFQDWFDKFSTLFGIATFHLTQTLEAAILNHFNGWDTIRNWDNHVAHLLNECTAFIHGSGRYEEEHGKCKLEYTDLFNIPTLIFGNIEMINFFDPASVEFCTGANDGVGACGYFTH